MTYPGGRVVHYGYDSISGNNSSDLNDAISRVSYVADDDGEGDIGTHLEEYSYLGNQTVVMRNRPEPGETMQLFDPTITSGDALTGLDRYGQIIDLDWAALSSGSVVGHNDEFKYGYDADGNRLYKTNEVNHDFDELYHANGASNGYDGLNRLVAYRQGALTDADSDGVLDTVSTAGHYQTWTLDALGNPTTVSTDGTPETRTYDRQNEITSQSATYDDNGNQTYSYGGTMKYDAWNRLVQVSYGSSGTLHGLNYAYDAAGRRITEGGFGYTGTGTPDLYPGAVQTDLYYSNRWQVVEEVGHDPYSGYDGNYDHTATYVYSPFYVDELILRDTTTTLVDEGGGGDTLDGGGHQTNSPVAVPFRNQSIADAPDGRLYVNQDANYNVTSVVDPTTDADTVHGGNQGAVVERYTEDPYGASTAWVEDYSSSDPSGSYHIVNRNQGQREDLDTQQYDSDNRVLDTQAERWVQQDPAGYVDGPNLYQLLVSSPISRLDPLGLADWGPLNPPPPPPGAPYPVRMPKPEPNLPKFGPGKVRNGSYEPIWYAMSGQGWFLLLPGESSPDYVDADGFAPVDPSKAPINPKTGLPMVTKVSDGMEGSVDLSGKPHVGLGKKHGTIGAIVVISKQCASGGLVDSSAIQPTPPPGYPTTPPTTHPSDPPATQPSNP